MTGLIPGKKSTDDLAVTRDQSNDNVENADKKQNNDANTASKSTENTLIVDNEENKMAKLDRNIIKKWMKFTDDLYEKEHVQNKGLCKQMSSENLLTLLDTCQFQEFCHVSQA